MRLLYKGLLTAGAGLVLYSTIAFVESRTCPASRHLSSYHNAPAFCVALQLYSSPDVYNYIVAEQRNTLRGRLFAPEQGSAEELIWVAERLVTNEMTNSQKAFIRKYFSEFSHFDALYERLTNEAANFFERAAENGDRLEKVCKSSLGVKFTRNLTKDEINGIVYYYLNGCVAHLDLKYEKMLAASLHETCSWSKSSLKYDELRLGDLMIDVQLHIKQTTPSV